MNAPATYRIAGALFFIGGMTSAIMAGIICLVLLLFGVGIIWLFPLLASIRSMVLGIIMMSGGRYSNPFVLAIIGIIVSIFSLDPVGFVCQIIALILVLQPDAARFIDGVAAQSDDEWVNAGNPTTPS